MKSKIFFLLPVSLLCLKLLYAQTYEIRAVNKGGGLMGVEMRTTSGTPPGTGNYVTDIVFGIKWLSSYGVDLATVTTSYYIKKSDVRKSKNGFDYQAFYAGNTPFNFPANWTLNDWVEVMSIVNTLNGVGTGTFEITEAGFDGSTDPNLGVDLVDKTPVINGKAEGVLIDSSTQSGVSDYFRTMGSGNWNNTNTWESSADSLSWHSATLTPDFNANTIFILNDHVVTVTSNVTIDQTTIAPGGTLIVKSGVILTVK